MFRRTAISILAFGAVLSISEIARASVINYTDVEAFADFAAKQKSCQHRTNDCSSIARASSRDDLGNVILKSKGSASASWDGMSWSTSVSLSAKPPGQQSAIGVTSASGTRKIKFNIPGADRKTKTAVGFTFILNGIDQSLCADDGYTKATLTVLDNHDSNNWGSFFHEQSGDEVDGGRTTFVNVSITNSSNASVTFSGQLLVRGPNADIAVSTLLQQQAEIVDPATSRKCKGNATLTLAIIPPVSH